MTNPIDTIREALRNAPRGGVSPDWQIPALAALTELEQQLRMVRASRDDWERQARGRGVVQYELLARAVAAETALAERDVQLEDALTALVEANQHIDDFERQRDNAETLWRYQRDRGVAAEQRANDLADALRAVTERQPQTVEWLRANGIVFDGPLGTDPDNWEHVAFSIYNDLCEADSIARAALDRQEQR